MPYIAPFELFCERTILAKIVTLVTGIEQPQTRQQRFDSVATATTANAATTVTMTNDDDDEESRTQMQHQQKFQQQQQQQLLLLLPPPTIATQAIQSLSILIQNVSRATSLYFLLSNDIVNELIQLPIESYRLAAAAAATSNITTTANAAATANIATGKKGGGERRLQQQQQQDEELLTHFVSFLKKFSITFESRNWYSSCLF